MTAPKPKVYHERPAHRSGERNENSMNESNAFLLKKDNYQLRLEPVAENIVRVTCTAESQFQDRPHWMLVDYPKQDLAFEQEETKGEIRLKTDGVAVEICKDSLACTYYDGEGKILFRERQWRPRDMEPVEVYHYSRGKDTSVKQKTTVDGVRVDAQSFQKNFDRMSYHTKLYFDFTEDEAVMGFGCHEEGYLNLRGRNRFLYQQNMKACVPFFWSTNGYGVLFDSYTDMTFHDDGYGSYLWTDVDGQMDYYIIAGGSFDDIMKGYRFLTGKAPLLPRWSFGYCQSKERYVTADELLEVTKEYRRRQIPLDLMILDWKSWEGELWGEKIFDRSRFPNPTAMMDAIHEEHAKLMISIWPHFAQGGTNHKELQDAGLLFLDESTYNAYDPKGREIYWNQANKGLFCHGIDAWWCDCTEPFEADWIDSPYKPEPEERQRLNVAEAKTYVDPEIMSAFSLLHSKGIYEGQRSVSEKRVLNLTRSAYAGQQRYGTVTWSGDISANWETLRKQIAEGLSFVSSGCPYWTLDIGGFFVKDWMQWYGDGHYNAGTDDPEYRELYVRWFQYGTFLPMMRSHGTDFAREVWRFGDEDSIEYKTLVDFIKLRYRLMPYIYSLAYDVTANDGTMMRPLEADFIHDIQVRSIEDQFMFGPAIMVCPVYEKGCKSRKVYLPEGETWYDFWTGKQVASGWQDAQTPFERIPVYVRGGSIIPMGPDVQYTGQVVEEPLDIYVYPGRDCEFTLYDDDGETYAYEKGEYSLRHITWNEATKTLQMDGQPYEKGVYRCAAWNTKIMG